METKLITLFIAFLLTSCSIHNKNKNSIEIDKKNWIDTYKTVAFWSCFRESYSNDSLVKLITRKDFIYQNEILADWEIIENAEDIGKKHAINIEKLIVFPKFEEGNKEEFLKKNYFLQNCLNYYASRELDSIAKKLYKVHLKKDKTFWKNYKPE